MDEEGAATSHFGQMMADVQHAMDHQRAMRQESDNKASRTLSQLLSEEQQLETVKGELVQSQEQAKEKAEQSYAEIAHLANDVKGKDARIASLMTQVQQDTKERQQLHQQLDEKARELSQEGSDLASLEEAVSALRSHATWDAQAAEFKSEMSKLQSQVQDFEATEAALNRGLAE